MSRIPDADERIARILGQREEHPITRQDGQDALPPSSNAGPGQVDATLRVDPAAANAAAKAEREAAAAKKAAVTQITQPSNEPAEDVAITLGDLRIFPNPLLNTWEAQFQRGGTASYVVARDGRWLLPGEALQAVYEALKSAKGKSK